MDQESLTKGKRQFLNIINKLSTKELLEIFNAATEKEKARKKNFFADFCEGCKDLMLNGRCWHHFVDDSYKD